ncbi:MAG: hydantoinase/oxoprolinase family protein [Roseiarcus sp.]
MHFAIDTGGTFTDLMVRDSSGLCQMFKTPTTPADPIEGVLDVLHIAAKAHGRGLQEFLSAGTLLIHGTTHALNAIITGRTAKTALLTTARHPDTLVLREGGRTDPFNFTRPYPQPYVPRSLTYQVPERIGYDGSVDLGLDEDTVLEIIAELKAVKIEAVAVCLLWSISNPDHEERVGALLEKHLPGIPVTLSHRVNPVIREFRRASSAAVDASLKPLMGAYMRDLEERLRDSGFPGRVLVVTSQAGVIDAWMAARTPIQIINSGPSMAPIIGRYFAETDEGAADAIVADTGGTTYDVTLVRNGQIPTTRETWIGPKYQGTMIGFPWVDVKSIGAGGGSIAWVDSGGLLHVGPRSAGAVPGPVCYGAGGTEPTVTDAALVLGYLDPAYFLGGAKKLDVAAAESAIQHKVAAPLGLDCARAAEAMISVVTENMAQAIFEITVNQGIDPRNAVLVGGGGGGGLNSVRIARRLGCKTLLIPEVAAALSAAGALMSDLKAEYRAAAFVSSDAFDYAVSDSVLNRLRMQCDAFVAETGDSMDSTITYKVDARYSSQVWEIEVPLRTGRVASESDLAAFVEDFHATHRQLFTFDDPASTIEITGWIAQVSCRVEETNAVRMSDRSDGKPRTARRAYFAGGGWCEAAVCHLESLRVGERVDGPSIIESPFTTIVLEPNATAVRRPSGSLSVDVGKVQ